MRHIRAISLSVVAILATGGHVAAADGGAVAVGDPSAIQGLLRTYCVGCHGEKKSKGQVRLDTLATLDAKVRLDLMGKVEEQLHFSEMPPDDEKQPSPTERKLLMDWVRAELQKSNAPSIEDKLRYPDFGNAVDHDKLFSGTIQGKAFTPVRRWLVSPQIFMGRVIDIFRPAGAPYDKYLRWPISFYGVVNPFVLPDRAGIRDYAISPLDGGHLLVMLGSAQWISQKQIREARVKKGEFKADYFENKADRFTAPTHQAFASVILNPVKPADDALVTAIQAQFGLVLQRSASEAELAKYLALTRSAIDLAGNTEGLRQMLVAVLLESEFLYRLEFGSGAPDASGRKLLSPREASYAISYALGDWNPDPALAKAAAEGRLNTKEDYRREVVRLLADENYFKGQIDPAINNSDVVSHPKVVRFFREFFGYPNAVKVFKDKNRSGGYYDNPGRGSSATPGSLIREADRVVALHIKQDKAVFERLLTSDEFFLYHNLDNEKGQQLIAEWKAIYEALKDTDWRTNPEKVFAEHGALLKKHRIENGKGVHANTLARVMEHFSYTFGKGHTPFTTFPWAHGNQFRYSQSYSLPATPGVSGSYGGDDHFDYQVVQPFKIANRKGILTHPAWLIAHSSNFHTDPIRRGRWIQEKLLAGRVPDVPITVDAKVPENPHMTFRERVESVTGQTQTACWKCHQHMNPLGYPFEFYDDFGRFRRDEPLENPENLVAKAKGKYDADNYKTKPVHTEGLLRGTGDPKLDGPVSGALEMIDRLATSTRVRQSIIRHTFRFYLGRNEMLSDSQTLIAADKAYVESGGSFNAVIVSLLTSDSFMYRK